MSSQGLGARKTNLTQKLGIGKGNFKKAIRDGLLLAKHDKDAYEVAKKYFNNKCAYCGMGGDIIQLTADHIKPSNQGGRFVRGNIIPACQKCNSLRRDLKIEEFIPNKEILSRIKDFQALYQSENNSNNIEEELGEVGSKILEQLDEALSIMRDVARNSIRSYEQNKDVQLEEWVKDFEILCKKYNLI